MNKLMKVVNIELIPAPAEKQDFIHLCLIDYRPDVEDVNPLLEKLQKLKESPGMDPIADLLETFTSVGSFAQQGPTHHGHRENGSILLTIKEYESIGKPTVGQVIELTMQQLTMPEPARRLSAERKFPERAASFLPRVGMKQPLDYFKQAFHELEGPVEPGTPPQDRPKVNRKKLVETLNAEGFNAEQAEVLISTAFRKELIFKTEPGFFTRLGEW